MLLVSWLVLCSASGSLLLLPFVLRRREIRRQYSGSRLVACPENQQAAAVNIDLRHAAATAIDGPPKLRLCHCTQWPERAHCGQPCLHQAIQPEPEESGGRSVRTKQIYHLPIAVAAFAAWCLGALWHSQYVFRTQWREAFALTPAQVKQMEWWLSPHLLTAAVCLLFAYGVAWLLAVSNRKGVLPGVLMAVLLCGTVLAAGSIGIARVPRELLVMESGYVALAAVTVGAIVGGLYNRLVLRSH